MSGYEYPQITGAVGGGGVAISAAGQSVSDGTVTFANSNGVSFGMVGSVITATVQPGAAAGIAAASAGTQQMTSGTLRFADSNGISFGISNSSQITASHNGLTTAAQSNHSHSLHQILSPSADVFFSFSQGRQIQFQFSNTGTFTTAASKQALFEIDVQGNLVDGADAVHIHQSDNDPTIDLLHLEAWGTNVTPLRISASRSIAMEINKPIAFFGTAPNTASVPLILGAGQSNQVSFLNANYLQGKLSSEFQSTGAYLTTAMQSQSSSVFAKTGFTSTTTGGTAVVGTHDTNGLSLGVPLFLTTAQPVGAYLTTARASNDAIGLGTAQTNVTWTVNSNGLSFNAGGYAGTSTGATNATVTLNSAGINISVAAPGGAGDGVNVIALNTNGNTAGATASQSTGTIYFAGGNNITLSQNANSITISGANAGGAQTGISSIAGSNTTYTSGMVIMSDQANITIGSSVNAGSQYLRFSVGNYITTARASNDAIGLNTAGTSVTWTVNSSGISLNAGAYLTTAQPVGAYLTTARASNDAIGLNTAATSVTWTVNSSGISLNAGAYLTTAQPVGAYLTTARASNDAIGLNTAGTSVTWTVNSSGISLNAGAYLTTAAQSSHTHGAPSITGGLAITSNSNAWSISVGPYITTARASNDALGLNTAATNVTWTANSSGLSINASGYAGTGTTGTNATMTMNSNGLALNAGGYAGTGTGFTGANISGTFTHNTQGLSMSLSVAPPGAAAENNWFTLAGNVAGNSSASGSTILLSGGNNITLSGTNGSQIIISAGNAGGGGVAMGVSSGGHTAGNTGTYSSGTFVFQGSNSLTMEQSTGAGSVHTIHLRPAMSQLTAGANMSLSSNGSTISVIALGAGTNTSATNASITLNTAGLAISVAAPGAGAKQSYFLNVPIFQGSTTMTMYQSTSGMFPFMLPYDMSIAYIRLMLSGNVLAASSTAVTTGGTSYTAGVTRTHNFVLYSQGAGGNSNTLQSIGSTVHSDVYAHTLSCAANSTQFSYSLRYTFPHSTGIVGFTKDYSSSAASLNFHTSQLTDLTGSKLVDFPFATSLSAGLYFLGYGVSTNFGTQRTADQSRAGIAFSNYGVSQANNGWGTLGAATNNSVNFMRGLGSYTYGGAGGTTASVDITRISTSTSQNMLIFQLMRIT